MPFHQPDYKGCNLYFILRGDSFRIVKFRKIGKIIRIKYRKKEAYSETHKIDIDVFGSLNVPDSSYIDIDVCNGGSMIKFIYNEKAINFFRYHNPELYSIAVDKIKSDGIFWKGVHVDQLINLTRYNSEQIYSDTYELLYIGKSLKEDIYERLNNHKTMQKIVRETNRDYPEKEVFVFIFSVDTEKISQIGVPSFSASIVEGHTLKKDFLLEDSINKSTIVNIAEAILITFFKPQYNSKLINSENWQSLKTYNAVGNTTINKLYYSLETYFEETKTQVVLKSPIKTINNKATFITCDFDQKNDEDFITAEDVSYLV